MSTVFEGCQGKPRTPTIIEKKCPQCGHEIELFSIDTEMKCENCGFVVYNDTLAAFSGANMRSNVLAKKCTST